MVRFFASRNALFQAVYLAVLTLSFRQVSPKVMTSSTSVADSGIFESHLELSQEEHAQLDDLARIRHDQQIDHWDPSNMIDEILSWPCPEADPISPCRCTVSDPPNYNFDLDCSAVSSDDDIKNIFANLFPFDDISQILIEGASDSSKVPIKNLTQNIFGTKSFELVKIVQTTLEAIEENVFQLSQDSLLSMSLEHNDLQLFPFQILPQYTALTFIHMVHNDISELPKIESSSLIDINMNHNQNLLLPSAEHTFVGAPELRTVRLSDTAITEIPTNPFSKLDHIKTIIIADNAISTLQAGAINAPSSTITDLNLASNSISTVSVGAITGMAPDGLIDLSDNEITILEEEVWKPILEQLENDGALVFDGNKLTCGCDMNWIMIDDNHKRKLSSQSACFTNDLVSELDVNFFTTNCDQPSTTDPGNPSP